MALDMRTLEAWERAARRALAADLPHQLRQRGDSILVPSKSTDGVTYWVQVVGGLVGDCTCPAGVVGRPCCHKAAVAIRLYERQSGLRITAIKPAAVPTLQRYIRAAR